MIKIIDYGLGNSQAFENLYRRLGITCAIAKSVDDLQSCTKLILPGVGSFDWAMTLFSRSGMKDAVEHLVKQDKIPLLGICVGMHMLGLSSEEGSLPGLGWINARVRKLPDRFQSQRVRLPHMGWNEVQPVTVESLFKGMKNPEYFYFLHSYFMELSEDKDMLASSDYYGKFASAVCSENVWGVQFHPEKSHSAGVMTLENFARL